MAGGIRGYHPGDPINLILTIPPGSACKRPGRVYVEWSRNAKPTSDAMTTDLIQYAVHKMRPDPALWRTNPTTGRYTLAISALT